MDSFVLGQVRAIREPFATIVADVRLGAFVHIHVRSQSRLDRKSFTALRTDVLFHLGVRRLVVLELLFRHKAFPAVRMLALVWFVAGVRVEVSGQLRLVAERLCFAAAGPMTVVVTTGLAVPVFAGMIGGHVPVKIFC